MPLCGISHCFPEYQIQRDNSNECVIEAVIRGSGVFRVGKVEYHPRAGDVYIAHIGSNHHYRTDPNDPWEKVWFNIQGTLVDELLKIYHLESVCYLPECRLESLFLEQFELMRTHLDNAHEMATLVTHRLIYHLARSISASPTPRQPEAERIKAYLDQRLTGQLVTGELARHIGRSESQCRRLFAETYGVSPYRYYLDRKLELARLMIARSDKSIKEIAAEIGFSDPYYFSNLFKKKYGTAPSALRRT